MRTLEITFWNSLYWLLYLIVSLAIKIMSGQGMIMPVLLIGSVFALPVNAFIATQDNILFPKPNKVPRIEIIPLEEEKPKKKPVKEEVKHAEKEKPTQELDAWMHTDVDLDKLDDSDDILG